MIPIFQVNPTGKRKLTASLVDDPLYIADNWEFFKLGRNVLSVTAPQLHVWPEQEYFQLLTWCAGRHPSEGQQTVGVLQDAESGELLAYGACYPTKIPFSPRKILYVASLFSKTNNTQESITMMDLCKHHAQAHNYDEISAICGRMNGCKKRFWVEKFGYKLSYYGFTYEIQK